MIVLESTYIHTLHMYIHTNILLYMCQQQIYPSNATYMSHMQISLFRYEAVVSIYMPHMNSLQSTK